MFQVSEGMIIGLFPLVWKTLQYPMCITVISLKAKRIDIDDYHFVIPLKELELGMRWIFFVIIISNSVIHWLK